MTDLADPVLAIGERWNNAQLMADCHQLGYIGDNVIDMTYGLGRFWTMFRPENLVTVDLDTERLGVDHYCDFRDLPYPAQTFDTAVFDPPYKLNGTGGSHASDAAYGVAGAYTRWQDRHELMKQGLTEALRVTRYGGYVLAKCQDQVCSGKVRWQTLMMTEHAESEGGVLVDMLHVTSYRAQPAGRKQLHARRDYSTLLVIEVRW